MAVSTFLRFPILALAAQELLVVLHRINGGNQRPTMGTLIGTALATLLAGFLLFLPAPPHALAADHVVGGSVWSIPPSADLYSAWAANRTFFVGDNLVFRFEMGFYDVVQVSRREYEFCTADDPFRTFRAGPAVVPLDAAGVRYFVCSVGNYCGLGVKLYVTVQNPH